MKLRLRITQTVPVPLAAVLSCLGLLVFAHPAHAGYYALTSTVTNNGVTTTGFSTSVGYPSPAITYTPASGTAAPQYTMSSTVTFSVTGTWTPSFAGDTSTPPATSYFLETGNTQATAQSGWYGGPSGSIQPATANGDDGLGDTATTTDPTVDDITTYTSTGTGKHLVQESGNTFTITSTVTDTASGSRFVYAQALLDVEPDTRSVVIGAGTSAKVQKTGTLAVDQYGNPVYQPGAEPATTPGLAYADLGLTYYSTVEGSDITTPLTYVASEVGNWAVTGSQYNWYSSIHGVGDSSTTSSSAPTIPSFEVNYVNPDGDPLDGGPSSGDVGSTDHVHLTFVDGSDGAQATANLYTTLHLPVISTQLTGPTSSSDPNFASTNTYPAVWTSSLNGPGSSAGISWSPCYAVYAALNAGGAAAQGLSSGIAVENPILGAVCAAAGVTASSIAANQTDTGTETFDGLWESPQAQWTNTPPPGWVSGGAPEDIPGGQADLCSCTVVESIPYNNKLYGCDQWGDAGYVGYTEYLLGVNPTGAGNAVATWSYTRP